MKNNWRPLIRGLAFLIVLAVIVCGLQGIFGLDSIRSYENVHKYLRESRGSLDAVYIGGSDVHAFWQPLFGWNERGIAVWNYSIDSLPVAAVKYLLIEAKKTQPQAVFIISLSTFKKKAATGSMENLHRIIDYQPFSLNKVRLINRLTEGTEYTGLDKLEFYFPIIRFHSRWDSLGKWVLGATDKDYKASMHTSAFRTKVTDLSKTFTYTDKCDPIPEDVESVMNELLDYCDEQRLQVLFIKAPQDALPGAQKRMNSLENLVLSRGYPCLDLLENKDDVGLQLKTDFYNEHHTNIHGSLKYCHYLADYLVEHYGFVDKRGTKGWESWDKAAAAYVDEMSSVALPFEFVNGPRDYSLSIAKLKELKKKGTTLILSWRGSKGADGYEVFRLCASEDHVWKSVAVIEKGTKTYTDTGLSAQTTYTYRVVPFRMIDGKRAYGNFDVKGIKKATGGQQ